MPSLYPVFERDVLVPENFNGMSLSAHLAELDDIAASLHLLPLASLIDARTMTLQVLEEDQLPLNCPPICWHSANAALAAVQGLLLCLEEHPERLPEREVVVPELRGLAGLLQEADTRGIRFHLLVDL